MEFEGFTAALATDILQFFLQSHRGKSGKPPHYAAALAAKGLTVLRFFWEAIQRSRWA